MPILEISILVFYCTSCQSLETKFLPLKTFWTLFQIKTLVRMTDFFVNFTNDSMTRHGQDVVR